MYSNKLYTPLRYPGGKARFAPFIANLMRVNGLDGGHYAEPYAGGAGVSLELVIDGHASHAHINDADPAVAAFWVAATEQNSALVDLVENTPVTIEEWLRCRAVLRGEIEVSALERGFATLFLNRTNRSGILKGGVIGGLSQSGVYTLEARFDKGKIISRLLRVGSCANCLSVYCEDALTFLKRLRTFLPSNSLIYLDPPYYVKGQGLYRNYYTHGDHVQIAALVTSPPFDLPWVVSYDNVAEIRAMYGASSAMQYRLNYTAQVRHHGTEIMFFSPLLNVPDHSLPASMMIAA